MIWSIEIEDLNKEQVRKGLAPAATWGSMQRSIIRTKEHILSLFEISPDRHRPTAECLLFSLARGDAN